MDDKILIPVVGFKDCKILKSVPHELTLSDKYIRCTTNCLVQQLEENEYGTKEQVTNKYRAIQIHRREHVAGCNLRWSRADEIWRVVIGLLGTATDIELNFSTMKEGIDIQEKVLNWLCETP